MFFDVLIVGAGPAGCAAAIHAANRGLRVGLIERTAYPRDLPGEALHPDVEQLFAELNLSEAILKAGFIRYPGWIREHGSERSFIPFDGPMGFRFGYQAWRSELDSILLDGARRAGATLAQPANCGELLLENERVTGVEVNGEPWSCDYLLDASGASGWLVKRLRLAVKEFSPRLVARFAYFRGTRALGVIPEFREHPCGWTWLARVKKNYAQCVQLSLSDSPPPLPECVPDDIRFRGANVTWRFVPQCAGHAYFLCGDAAAVLDPAASSGVARALASGLKAADLIADVAKNQMDSHAAAATYRRWYADLFTQQARQLASRYSELENPPHWLNALKSRFTDLDEALAMNSLANAASAVITSS
jgi:flavin-dependent dehydrogenase